MPAIGSRKSTTMGNGYKHNPIYSFAESFAECAKDVLNESGVDLFTEPQKALRVGASRDTLKRFFVEDAVDQIEQEVIATNPGEDVADIIEGEEEALKEQFENDSNAILENAALGSLNPVIGMTFPIHKNILMNNVFDKGAIPKFVAREPKFTVSMEQRILVTPDGDEIDMYKDQYKIADAIDSTAPFVDVEIALPESEGNTNVLEAVGGADDDNLSIDTYVSAVKLSVYLEEGDINPETGVAAESDGAVDCWIPVKLNFTPSYGEIDRIIAAPVEFTCKQAVTTGEAPSTTTTVKTVVLKDVITGYMKNNAFMLQSATGVIEAVRLSARLDTSSATVKTCSVKWKVRTDIVEIGSANPINVTVSPEEVKDVGALYNVNQLSKVLALMKTSLGDYKDTKIKKELDKSFMAMPSENKYAGTFDFAPRSGYALDHVEWRYKTFMDYLDSVVTGLLQVLNDPNMTVSVFGAPDLIRKITPTEYTYQTPGSIGPVDLDFVKTVVTSDKRVYQFIASDKLRGNSNLIIVLCPRNTDRIVYRIYDYQMYVSNEIRNVANPALPAIHAFERWKFVEYQPVQGRVQILHPTGLVDVAPNSDPIGVQYKSDFNLLG